MQRAAAAVIAYLLVGVLTMPGFVPYTPAPTHPGAFRQPVAGPAAPNSPPGTPILVNQFGGKARLAVEIAFGADLAADASTWTWTDITGDTLVPDGGTINMTVGRQDESIQTSPAYCTLLLDNTAEKYTPYDPYSPNWPNVRRNTPVRIRFTLDGTTLNPSWTTLFEGLARGFPPNFDVTGNYAVVPLTVDGYLKRYDRPGRALRSPLYRAITSGNPTAPLAYWPMEDGSSSTQSASALAGGTPMRVLSGTVGFAGQTGPDGSSALPDFSQGGRMAAPVATSTATSWRVEFALKLDAIPSATFAAALQMLTAGTVTLFEVDVTDPVDGGIYLQWINNGTAAAAYSNHGVADAAWHWIRLDVTRSGADLAYALSVDSTVVLSGTITGAAPVPPLTQVIPNPTGAASESITSMGHLVVWAPATSSVDTHAAFTGYTGENAVTRLQRLCGEQGVPISITGTSNTLMGVQGVDTFINLLRACETADDGMLYDGLSAGLQYLTRSSRYNQPAAVDLDASAGDPGGPDDPLIPLDDDLRDRNIVTIGRTSGSSATVEQTTGPRGTDAIGEYEYQATVNYADDTWLAYRAGHEVNKGTFDGFRWPQQTILFHRSPALLGAWLQMAPGTRFDLTNLRTVRRQLSPDPVDLMLDGYGQSISKFIWTAMLNGSPNRPWRVIAIEDATLGRVQTDGSTLAAAASTGATSLSVASTGPLWTTAAADFPLSVEISGIQVTVSAISGSSSPQTFTVTGVAKNLNSGDAVTVWKPGVIAL